jgi:hypothetical protein
MRPLRKADIRPHLSQVRLCRAVRCLHDPKPIRQSTSAAAQWAPLARFYPHQMLGLQAVSLGKLGSWFLLLIISYALVAIMNRPQPFDERQFVKT